MTNIVNKLKAANNSRESLIALKNDMKNNIVTPDSDDIKYLSDLLKLEDAKSRKNVAIILGMTDSTDVVKSLCDAYENETTEFVKASYILALKGLDISDSYDRIEAFKNDLLSTEITDENKKHYDEQMEAFNEVIGSTVKKHTFTGKEIPSEVVLITPNGLGHVTADAMDTSAKKVLSFGVSARINSLEEIKDIRTYKELMFLVPNMKKISADPFEAAKTVANSELKAFLCGRHKEKDPWGYRLNLISKMEDKKKASFIKRFSGELFRLSDGFYVNQPSDYEIELRFIETKDGSFNTMVKLLTISDDRFAYRKEFLPVSIRPELAANIVALAKDYMIDDAQVIDPFCGVGTMLIERCKVKPASPVYGVDTYGEAIEKARINTKKAHQDIFYVNRNFFDFKHDYLFDEIITNMPFSLDEKDILKLNNIYNNFFLNSMALLKSNAVIIMYTRNLSLAEKYSYQCGYNAVEKVLISEKEDSYLCVFKK